MRKIYFMLLMLLHVTFTKAQTPQLVLTTFATGFTKPLGIENCGDSRLFIVQQGGKIYIVDSNGVVNPTPFLNITSEVNSSGDEQGLLGLAFHPDYKNNRYFYVNYIHGGGSGYTRISRFKTDSLNPNHADSTTEMLLLTFAQPFVNHNGGCLRFGPDGYLYDGQGDGGSGGDPGNRAQQKDTILGKILRIDVNSASPYGIPPDNPYTNGGGRPEVWDYGMRNPWRFTFDRLTGDLWIADVGQSLYEEVDFQPAHDTGGINYGWHCYEGFHPYSGGSGSCNGHIGLTDPIYEYGHSSPCTTITGGYVYRGTQFANLFGKYFFTDFCHGHIETLQANDTGGYTHLDLGQFDTQNYTTFGEDYKGEMYLAERVKGTIVRITDTSTCKPVAYFPFKDTVHICQSESYLLQSLSGNGLTYQWKRDGNIIPGATSYIYHADTTGNYTIMVTNQKACSNESNNATVVLYPKPAVSLTLPPSNFGGSLKNFYCFDAGEFGILSGQPTGGTFSGPGVNGDTLQISQIPVQNWDTAVIIYTYTDSFGCLFSVSDTAHIVSCTGNKIINAEFQFGLYPNPTTGILNLQYSSPVAGEALVKISNTIGETIFSTKENVTKGDNTFHLDLNKETNGIYLVQFITTDNSRMAKIILEK